MEDDSFYKSDIILSDNSLNPEKRMIDNEEEKKLINDIEVLLTDFEKQVFELKIAGFSYKEIAEILDKDVKSVDNAVQRIRVKAKSKLK